MLRRRAGRRPRQERPRNECVIYVRVSDPRQVENTSLEVQERACREHAKRRKWIVREVFREEGRSAKTMNRPQMKRMLDFCAENRKSIGTVIAYHRDRTTRDFRDYARFVSELRELKIQLAVIHGASDDTASGEFMSIVEVANSQRENREKGERVRECMTATTELGGWPHQAPIGYRNLRSSEGKALIAIDPEKGPLVRSIFERVASGEHSVNSVARWARSAGLRTKHGNKIGAQTLKRMLGNPFYAGWIDTDLGTSKGNHEPLITEELYRRVQAVLDGRRYKSGPHALDNPSFPLRRFVRCAACGTPITGSSRVKKLGGGSTTKTYSYYWCRRSGCRAWKTVPAEQLEQLFLDLLEQLSAPSSVADVLAATVHDVIRATKADNLKLSDRASRTIRGLRTKRERTLEAVVDGRIQGEDAQALLDKYDRLIEDAELELDEAAREIPEPDQLVDMACRLLEDPAGAWRTASHRGKLALQSFLFPEGLVFGGTAFGTVVTSPLFSRLRVWQRAGGGMVTPGGFEPPSPG